MDPSDEAVRRAAREARALFENPAFDRFFADAREVVVRRLEEASDMATREDLAAELRALRRVRARIADALNAGESLQRNVKRI